MASVEEGVGVISVGRTTPVPLVKTLLQTLYLLSSRRTDSGSDS